MTRMLGIKRLVGWSALFVGQAVWYAGTAAAAAIFLSQIMQWLHDGQWASISVSDTLLRVALLTSSAADSVDLSSWIYAPKSWIGLQELVTVTPAIAALLAIAVVGALLAGWGRGARALANRAIHDTKRSEKLADFSYATINSAAQAGLPPSNTTLTNAERDILRWLALNGNDATVLTAEAMGRHLRYPALEITSAIASLVRRGYATNAAGRAELSGLGLLFCVDQGWTMATPRA